MPSFPQQKELEYILSRLKNEFGEAEGSNLPLKIKKGIRVPVVNNFKILDSQSYSGGTQFTLIWSNPNTPPNSPVRGYKIYIENLQSNQGLSSSSNKVNNINSVEVNFSPAIIRVSGDAGNRVTFRIQTILANGMTSDIKSSPSQVGILL